MNDVLEHALNVEGITGKLADVARSIFQQESGSGKNTKTSNAGAMGGMQVIPSTFASVADQGWDMNNPVHNARAGIRYLKQLDKQAGGDPALTAAGYYGGPGALEKARQGIAVRDPRNPNAPDTLQYGQQVAARLGKAVPVATPVASILGLPDSQVPASAAAYEAAMAKLAAKPEVQPPAPIKETPYVAPAVKPEPTDPWADFQAASSQVDPMTAQSLNFGGFASAVPAVNSKPSPINFQPFGGYGRKRG